MVETIEIIYDTDHLPNAQYFDCMHYTNEFTNTYSIKYCIQPENITSSQKQSDRNEQTPCDKGATLHSFSSLFENNIHPNTVVSTFWSGIDQADRYGAYYFLRQLTNLSVLIDNDFICNCSSLEGVFGRHCEYELYVGSTLDETAHKIKINRKGDALYGQLQRRRMCYTSIDCEYGLLCLDWRNICDGTQNCVNGVDEENCDRIEMNECLENEFRCQNGLCIPEEYWLDGELDCQDASDELDRSDFETGCPTEKGMECDEHVCWKHPQIPCGDGQCVFPYNLVMAGADALDRYKLTIQCYTLRDVAFQCEIHRPFPLWTLPGGFCTHLNLSWGNYPIATAKSACELLLKCHLSRNLSTHCSMDDRTFLSLSTTCKSNFSVINYPPGPLLSPFIYTYYKTDHQVSDDLLLPDYLHVYGELRCAGFHVTFKEFAIPLVSDDRNIYYSLESIRVERSLCRTAAITDTDPLSVRNHSNFAPHFDTSCWHKWLPFFNLSTVEEVVARCNEYCLSHHRINDGAFDCLLIYETVPASIRTTFDETTIDRSTERYYSHCLNCISKGQNSVCLPIAYIDAENPLCKDGKDTYLVETGIAIRILKCNNKDASECHIIRNHVIQSFVDEKNITITAPISFSTKVLPFVQYCDTYFDTEKGIDENVEYCLEKWICTNYEYRCRTGQCIPIDWLCDGVWDCSDASDEQGLLLQVDDFTDEHNRLLLKFSAVWMGCFERYKKQAFANICNITIEYPCLLANVGNPLNFQLNRPCIELKRIGDGHIDCLGKSDERNVLKCHSDVLGLRFGCTGTNDECMFSRFFCNAAFHCPAHDELMACFYKNNSSCNEPNDVTCLNGTCQPNARCNGEWECLNGEDEYWCYFDLELAEEGVATYRSSRRARLQSEMTLTNYLDPSTNPGYRQLPEPPLIDQNQWISMKPYVKKQMPNDDIFISDDMILDKHMENLRRDPQSIIKFELPFICNRGIPIKLSNEHTRCLCSPSYYGDYCEFQANRISVVTHLNLTMYKGSYASLIAENCSILVSCTFCYKGRIVDRHEFYVHSSVKEVKQKFYFAYSRAAEFQEQKRNQHNGTRFYSVQFEAFYLQPASYPTVFGMWHFPIEFDFLPAFRFAKVLHFNNTNRNYSCNLDCAMHGYCLRLENEITQFICSCQSGWYGDRCDEYDKRCENFCHPHAICQPQGRGFINGDERPACLCPHGQFGPTCHLTYPSCTQCQNGGSCYLTYDPSHIRLFECICTDDFYGDYCQFPKPAAILRFVKSSSSSSKILATSIQYYDVTIDLNDLYLSKQQVFFGQPIETRMSYVQNNVPSVIIIKSYSQGYLVHGPLFHLVYSQQNSKASINMTVKLTNANECAHTHMLFDSKIIQNTNENVLVFKYHELCRRYRQNRSSIVCFRDDHYFCLCNMTIQRAQCLRFDPYSDKCQHCLSRGRCIRGNLEREQDFICLCPRCTYGSVCQFSAQLFSFTLDSLISKDVQVRQNLSIAIYVLITSVAFLTGIFSNLCSLLVFSRKNPRKVGVGNYLFLVSIMNILALIFRYAKIIHILLGSSGLLMNNKINLILCKLLSSILSISTRINHWLTSLVTMERLSSVLFPTKNKIRKPNVALFLSLITMLILCGMHTHEFLLYTIIPADPQQINSGAIICVTNFDNQSWLIYNRINVLIHHLVPFVIQVISITLLIVWAAKSRAKTSSPSKTVFSQILKKQFQTKKELYVTPTVIILAALPQLIFTSSFSCTELSSAWQRYALLIAYLLSLIPQICGFFIFVLPSSSYKAEFINTRIGQRLFGAKKTNQNDGRMHSSLITKRQTAQI